LHLFLGYRITIAAILLILFFAFDRGGLGSDAPRLFAVLSTFYIVTTIAVSYPHLTLPTIYSV